MDIETIHRETRAWLAQRFADPIVMDGFVERTALRQRGHLSFVLRQGQDHSLSCFIPAKYLRDHRRFPFVPADGQYIRVIGQLRLNTFFSSLELLVERVEPLDLASREASRQRLTEELRREGHPRRRPFPRPPHRIGLITPYHSHAYDDVKHVIASQGASIQIVHRVAAMQGEQAVQNILSALESLQDADVEVIVITRGGGPSDAIAVFDDPRLVWAIANSAIPTVVGIGHARDHPIAEIAADWSASTPTNAAWVLFEGAEATNIAGGERPTEQRQQARSLIPGLKPSQRTSTGQPCSDTPWPILALTSLFTAGAVPFSPCPDEEGRMWWEDPVTAAIIVPIIVMGMALFIIYTFILPLIS